MTPGLGISRTLSSEGIPVFHELVPAPDILRVFEYLQRLPYPLLLDSATAHHKPLHADATAVDGGAEKPPQPGAPTTTSPVARYSFAMAEPDTIISATGLDVSIMDVTSGTIDRKQGRALDVVSNWVGAWQSTATAQASDNGLPPFRGGVAGYVGYEYGGVLERLTHPAVSDLGIPDVVLGRYPWVVAWDHWTGQAWLFAANQELLARVRNFLRPFLGLPSSFSEDDSGSASVTTQDEATRNGVDHRVGTEEVPARKGALVTSVFTQPQYETAVEKVKEYIRAGDIFQANLSQRFSAEVSKTPWELYKTLRTVNPAPFAAFFDFGDGVLISASPERFLHVNSTGAVETRPIKGTRPRGASAEEDALFSSTLTQSGKDAAEHVMIVDVLRNDISRVCEYGSVKVPQLMELQQFATVHHLVSTITGQLRPNSSAIDLVHACFPGGSITGAPKVRAMEIIAELEPVVRNVYCGTVGYFGTNGTMDSSIVIRTFLFKQGRVYFSAGGGIVADSSPDDEYQETLDKARALVHALGTSF